MSNVYHQLPGVAVFIHPSALCESSSIGAGTNVWAFAHVLEGAVIGEDCNICDSVFIENDVVLGDRVTVKCGVQLWDGCVIKDDVFVGPNATFTNDPFPRSKNRVSHFPITVVHQGASVGANSTILPGINIGRYAMVGAGAVVTNDVPAYAIVVGNPAQIIGYADGAHFDPTPPVSAPVIKAALPEGVEVLALGRHTDLRGSLVATDFAEILPFIPQRSFVVFGVPSRHVRGEHAHRECWQFLVCVKGSITLHVTDTTHSGTVVLESPEIGVVVPPMVWASQYRYSDDAILLVLASHPYDNADYIRDYEEMVALKSGR